MLHNDSACPPELQHCTLDTWVYYRSFIHEPKCIPSRNHACVCRAIILLRRFYCALLSKQISCGVLSLYIETRQNKHFKYIVFSFLGVGLS